MTQRIPSNVFSARLAASEALLSYPAAGELHQLGELATDLDGASAYMESAMAGAAYAAFASLLRIVQAVTQWRHAVLEGLPEAERFLRSARERYKLWRREYEGNEVTAKLLEVSSPIADLTDLETGVRIVNRIGAVPLPIALAAREPSRLRPQGRDHKDQREHLPLDLTVAFLKFQIDSVPAKDLHRLTPGEVHDLEIEVRLSRWADGDSELVLTPVSVEPASTYDFPIFRLARPRGEPPYTLAQKGRAILRAGQGLNARPFEFKYAAEFLPTRSEQPVAVVGHRTLLIDGLSFSESISGYPDLDRRLIDIREFVRREILTTPDVASDFLNALRVLFNMAGRAVQDASLNGDYSEKDFQELVRDELRRDSTIGARLDEHAHAAGGITDLSVRGIPLELKVEKRKPVVKGDTDKFLGQAAAYAVAKGSKLAIVCVLDNTTKLSAVGSPADLVSVTRHDTDVLICSVVIQSNLARPSAIRR